ncbi:MAG: VRR-NUC domain-containing protein [Halioglobus sp.]
MAGQDKKIATGGQASIELKPKYYLSNFQHLCDSVTNQYDDLLTVEEKRFLEEFARLSEASRCLYIRLISRRGPWFRDTRLAYSEIGPLSAPITELVSEGFLTQAEELTVEELGKLFTRDELQRVFGTELPTPKPTSKGALLEAITELAWSDKRHYEIASSVSNDRIIAPLGSDTVALLQLLFFGNRRQSLTDFVLSDLGLARYYPYSLARALRLFPSREAIEDYQLCGDLSDTYWLYQELDPSQRDPTFLIELGEVLCDLEFVYEASSKRWFRLCNRVARDLERQEQWVLAYKLYGCSKLHPARERTLRVLEQMEQWEDVRLLVESIKALPWCEAERDALRRMEPRLRRKMGEPAAKRPRQQFAELRLSVTRGSASVEIAVAQALSAQWHEVHYVENTLMCGLFGLAFWEQIFAPIPGAFNNAFQSVPADMYEQEFLRRRQTLLEQRLQQLELQSLESVLDEAYINFQGYQNRWVSWRYLSRELVAAAAACIPSEHLLSIWQRMLFDPGENRRGFPDLIAFGDEPGDYLMLEVKGPGDTLQESQKRWLRHFQSEDIPAQVGWVEWCDA